MNKQELRAMFLEKRKTLTPNEHALRSKKVCDQAIQFIQKTNYKRVHLFLPIEKQREVDTTAIFSFLKQSHQHHVILPKVNHLTNELVHLELTDKTELIKAKFGISEPNEGITTAADQIDCVFIPLICFDKKGNRIGYGGGYYDRFLRNTAKETLKIGLAITPPLDFIPYSEMHDVTLDYCINHQAIYRF